MRALALNPLLPFPGHLPAELLASPLLTWNTATAFRHAQRQGPVAYYVMSPFEGVPRYTTRPTVETLLPPHALQPDVPLVMTLYDLIPLYEPQYYLADPGTARRYHIYLEMLRQAHLVLAISEYSRREGIRLAQLDPERVVTIGAGVSRYFRPPGRGDDPRRLVQNALPRIRRPFIFSVGGADDRKNGVRLIEAYASLPSRLRQAHQLVITCELPKPYEEFLCARATAVGLDEDEVVFTGYVPDPVLRALYQAARLFVFPSLYEGFGLPPAEAIACDCPTITSNTSSLPEVLDWDPAAFDPLDSAAIAAVMERALTDAAFREQLREVGRQRVAVHRWEAVAARTIAALHRLPPPRDRAPLRSASSHRDQRIEDANILCCRSRLRLALVGPLPPTVSGIADYNARLAVEMAQRCELDLLTPTDDGHETVRQIPGARRFPVSALGCLLNPAAYDAIIYTVGNSEQHHATYEAARRYPGIVWLHDVRLHGFYFTYAEARQGDPGAARSWLMQKALELYGERVPLERLPTLDWWNYRRFGLGLTQEWVRSARGILVNSALAERLLRLDQGPDALLPPVWRLPFALPQPASPSTVERDRPPVIASFGLVGQIKAPDLLIDALRRVRQVVPARLVFVGPVAEWLRSDLQAYAASRGVANYVEFTGHVSGTEYQCWLRRATCAAQLRLETNGESSGAIGDCVSAGLPVVTNVIGAREEYLPDAVVAIDPALSVEELADRLIELLTDLAVWQRHSAAALAHARQHTFAHLADRLIEIVETLTDLPTGSIPGAR
ncbi:MAG: glycosyltransferase [Chloroflexi bacterium]|nr:glycosyltransferase [Chloroflexota bacterium]